MHYKSYESLKFTQNALFEISCSETLVSARLRHRHPIIPMLLEKNPSDFRLNVAVVSLIIIMLIVMGPRQGAD